MPQIEEPTRPTGLPLEEAVARLAADGYNELPSARRRSALQISLGVAREPMFVLLLACGTTYLVLGDVREAVMLLFFVGVVIGITLYQEDKTEHALDALRNLSSPRAVVIRAGEAQRIPGREVVRGDILVLAEGDRIAADARLLSAISFETDESLLTGESLPVRKREPDPAVARHACSGANDDSCVYAGTMVVRGNAIAEVQAVGTGTRVGRIGRAMQTLEQQDTPLQREMARLVRIVAVLGAVLCATVVVAYGLSRGDWLHGLLSGLAMAMAVLPEEFPVVLAVFLALGAWRISRRGVLTRRMAAVELLGAATVLCVDKTGTLTQNRMSVKKLWTESGSCDLDTPHAALAEPFHELVEYAILASQRDPFDPMEQAMRGLGTAMLGGTEHLHDDWELVREYPLSKELLALSHVWRARDDSRYTVAAKGAPEAIADLCHLGEARTRRLMDDVIGLAAEGLRVIAVAKAQFRRPDLPSGQHDYDFQLVGLVGLADPVRASVPAAVAACREAGIRIIMITGDYPVTARSVARQIGLVPADKVISGTELDRMGDPDLEMQVRHVGVFARVSPEQKLRLVQALRANGEIVAMTGDGVNDGPALKAAHIGVAMGGHGTDVAREAAGLVLVDDDFSSLVHAVGTGRRISDNLRKAMAYIIAVHVPIAGLSLIPVLLGWSPLLMPVHIVFLQLVIDPTCSVVFEAQDAEADVMRRPPRDPGAGLFGRRAIVLSVLQGSVVLAVVVGMTGFARHQGLGEEQVRTLGFVTLVISNLALILANLSWSRPALTALRSSGAALRGVTAGTLAILAAVVYVPELNSLFRLGPLGGPYLLAAAAAGAASVLWFELYKWWRRPKLVS
ncbi:MAG: cation-translocating P-type ATPase [Gammaproteobacteria bacterium]|nr:cation-translocating P-type ATPase [Gammaproteobacteria bacterium]